MVGITSYFCDIQTSDYYIIYNKDTGEFNKLPSSSGTYVFINVLYNAESNTMKLVEYQIEYTKQVGIFLVHTSKKGNRSIWVGSFCIMFLSKNGEKCRKMQKKF